MAHIYVSFGWLVWNLEYETLSNLAPTAPFHLTLTAWCSSCMSREVEDKQAWFIICWIFLSTRQSYLLNPLQKHKLGFTNKKIKVTELSRNLTVISQLVRGGSGLKPRSRALWTPLHFLCFSILCSNTITGLPPIPLIHTCSDLSYRSINHYLHLISMDSLYKQPIKYIRQLCLVCPSLSKGVEVKDWSQPFL